MRLHAPAHYLAAKQVQHYRQVQPTFVGGDVGDIKNAIETAGVAEVITSLQLLKAAVDAGELDAQMEALSGAVAEGFVPKPKVAVKAVAKA